jgi:SAM-dependent methyltransferase
MYNTDDIIEFTFCTEKKAFIPLKKRSDKIDGNFIGVAKDNFDSIVCPFNLEQLEQKKKKEDFFMMKRFHNWVKRYEIQKNARGEDLIDIACGKGADIHKWLDAGIRNVYAYDNDPESIKEAISRFENCKKQQTFKKGYNYTFHLVDIRNTHLAHAQPTVNVVTCFFALHYFLDTLDKFIDIIDEKLNKGGVFMCCFNEKKAVTHYINSIDKLDIDQNSKEFHVKLIDSDHVEMSIDNTVISKNNIERIIDADELIESFSRRNFTVEETYTFDERYPEWRKIDKKSNHMSDTEMFCSFMNRMYVFRKN